MQSKPSDDGYLDDSRSLLAAIVESSHDAIISKSLDGVVTSWNRAAERIFGYAPHEMIGRSISILMPEGRDEDFRVILSSVRRGERVEHYETTRRTKDGRIIDVALTVSPVTNAAGKIVGASKIVRDITQRKRSEAMFRAYTSTTRILAEASGRDSGIEAVIRELCQLLRGDGGALWLPCQDRRSLQCVQTWHEPGSSAANDLSLAAVRTLTRSQGRVGRAWVSGSPVFATDEAGSPRAPRSGIAFPLLFEGEVIGVMELAGDGLSQADPERDQFLWLIGSQIGQFLERKRVEEERERLLARLTQADRLKNEFLAMLSHELRNPLAAIRTAVELLDMAFDDPDQRSWAMEVVARQVQNLTHLMDDLLDVSRVTRGKILLKKRVVDASEIVRQAVETVGAFLDDREHALELSLDPGLWVEADATRLEQIIVNLLSNAVKYTESGGLIRVEAFREDRDVVCIVRDSGVGIPPDRLELIFELFVQGDRSVSRSEGGLGIGLTMVKSLTELHSGAVIAHSDGEGKGSEFIVRFPAAEAAAARPLAQATA